MGQFAMTAPMVTRRESDPKLMPPASLDSLRALAEAGGARIQRVDVAGHVYWIKRPEHLSLRMRLQKGDPKAAFEAEVAAHTAYADQGLPVAKVVAATDSYLITHDGGTSLKKLLRDGDEAFPMALTGAAQALAALHSAGVNHGRPSLKDICWDGTRIAFLDLERAGREANAAHAQSTDLMILIFSTAVETGGDISAMQTARDAYLSVGAATVWKDAQSRARRYAPLGWLAWPVAKVLKGNREYAAVAPFFRFMRG